MGNCRMCKPQIIALQSEAREYVLSNLLKERLVHHHLSVALNRRGGSPFALFPAHLDPRCANRYEHGHVLPKTDKASPRHDAVKADRGSPNTSPFEPLIWVIKEHLRTPGSLFLTDDPCAEPGDECPAHLAPYRKSISGQIMYVLGHEESDVSLIEGIIDWANVFFRIVVLGIWPREMEASLPLDALDEPVLAGILDNADSFIMDAYDGEAWIWWRFRSLSGTM
jgi:hypothetical protein